MPLPEIVKVYGLKPPVALMVIWPSEPPLQSTFFVSTPSTKKSLASPMVVSILLMHPFLFFM